MVPAQPCCRRRAALASTHDARPRVGMRARVGRTLYTGGWAQQSKSLHFTFPQLAATRIRALCRDRFTVLAPCRDYLALRSRMGRGGARRSNGPRLVAYVHVIQRSVLRTVLRRRPRGRIRCAGGAAFCSASAGNHVDVPCLPVRGAEHRHLWNPPDTALSTTGHRVPTPAVLCCYWASTPEPETPYDGRRLQPRWC